MSFLKSLFGEKTENAFKDYLVVYLDEDILEGIISKDRSKYYEAEEKLCKLLGENVKGNKLKRFWYKVKFRIKDGKSILNSYNSLYKGIILVTEKNYPESYLSENIGIVRIAILTGITSLFYEKDPYTFVSIRSALDGELIIASKEELNTLKDYLYDHSNSKQP